MNRTATALSALLLATLPAVAQTHYCMGGDLDHMTTAEISSCRAKMTAVRETVKQRGAPSGWRFLVVCDEGSWQDVAALTGSPAAALRTADFQTDRDMQVTFIRGGRIAAGEGSTAKLLNAALEGVPGRYTQPGIGVTPAPIPNVQQQKRELPALQIAEAHQPESHGGEDVASGE